MADLMEEVQSILGAAKPPKKGSSRGLSEMHDPADEAFELLKSGAELSKMLQTNVDSVTRGMSMAKSQAERLAKMGAGGALAALDLIGATPLKALKDLRMLVDQAITQIESIVKQGAHGRGMMGRKENLDRYLSWLDRKLASLSEASSEPYKKPTPDNDYSAELLAAATDAADYLSSPSQLEIGTKVSIGRKSLYVVSKPKMVDQGCLVTLGDQNDPNQPGDAYELVLPLEFQGDESEPPAMDSPQMTVEPTAEAILSLRGRSVKILAADIRLNEEDYGDHMYDYQDFGPAMGRIEPGDKITWMNPTMVLRVIGREDNAAIVKPDSMDDEMYGSFRAAAQFSSVPVGNELPAVPQRQQWQPGMDPIPSNRDLPGRGGTHALDAHTTALQSTLTGQGGISGGECASLVGARVLTYNPHTGKYSMATGKKPGEYEMADTIQIVGHDPSLPAAVGESMTLQRFELAIDEAMGPTTVAKLRHVVESGKVMKVNGVLMNAPVASVMLRFYGAVSESNRARMDGMGVVEMMTVSQRMLKRLTEGSRGEIGSASRSARGLPENAVTKYPSGKYGFAGKVDYRLGHIKNDGTELTSEDEDKVREMSGSSNPSLVAKKYGWKARVFSTAEAAESAAKKLGVKYLPYNEDVISTDPRLDERTYILRRRKKKKQEAEEGDGGVLDERTYNLRRKKRKQESGALSDALGDALDEGFKFSEV